MAVYFISDLHLSPEHPRIAQGLCHFLGQIAARAQAIYILGDLFDSWIGDDEDDPFHLQIIEQLAEVSRGGAACHFMHGNRDFLVGQGFAAATGFALLPEAHALELDGEHLLLMHGDSLCTDDQGYMAFRAQVRTPAWQQQILSLPLAQRRAIAADLRAKSQSMSALKAEDIMDVNPSEVARVMAQMAVKTLIHGHTHRPAVHPLASPEGGQRLVLGDWSDTHGWYLVASGGQLDLIRFEF